MTCLKSHSQKVMAPEPGSQPSDSRCPSSHHPKTRKQTGLKRKAWLSLIADSNLDVSPRSTWFKYQLCHFLPQGTWAHELTPPAPGSTHPKGEAANTRFGELLGKTNEVMFTIKPLSGGPWHPQCARRNRS